VDCFPDFPVAYDQAEVVDFELSGKGNPMKYRDQKP
jgi:hypothetical protein